jgi:prevent-host-death family protein
MDALKASAVDNVVACDYIESMRTVGLRELKSRLSEYVRIANQGEDVLVTDRDRVVAVLSAPDETRPKSLTPLEREWIAKGILRPALRPNGPDLYPEMPPGPYIDVNALLDWSREDKF